MFLSTSPSTLHVCHLKNMIREHHYCTKMQQTSCLQIECSSLCHKPSPRGFREFGSTSTQLQNPRLHVTAFQDLPIQWCHLQDHLRPATHTAAATIGLHIHRISEQSIKNHLREATMLAGVDLTHFQTTHQIWWHLGLCRCSLYMEESLFSLY